MDNPHCTFYNNQNFSRLDWKDYNKLREAVRSKDVNLVKCLVDGGAQVNGSYHCYDERTPLHLAVISRCSDIMKILLDNGADVNILDAVGDTPLTMAAKMGNIDALDLLLSYDVQKYRMKYNKLSHLHIACMRNKVDVVKKLIAADHGISMDRRVLPSSMFWPGFTPLHFAVYFDSSETVKLLLKCGANMMAKDRQELTPLHYAHIHHNETIIDLLLAAHKYELKNPASPQGITHFHIACTRDDPSVVEHFLKLDIDINLEVQGEDACHLQGWKPIDFAMYYECPKVIELLLKYKADYTMKSRCKMHPDILEYAFATGNDTIYNLLSAEPIEPKDCFREIEKIPKYHLDCSHDNGNQIMRGGHSSYINVPICRGYTPLHLAVKYNSVDASKFLTIFDADIMAQDSKGKTPLHLAFEQYNDIMVNRILENYTTDMGNKTDNVGLSVLHILCTTDQLKTIESLLLKGVDVNARVGSESPFWAGFTPKSFACEYEKIDVVKLLLKYNANVYIENGSIFDHFDLVYNRIDDGDFDADFTQILFENLVKVLSSPSIFREFSNIHRVSVLHVLCCNSDADLQIFEQYLTTHHGEVNQTIESPQSRQFHKCTPLHIAMLCNEFEKAVMLVEVGADLMIEDGHGNTPIECTFSPQRPLDISEDEIEIFFSPETPIEFIKPSHFFVACCSFAFDFVEYVMENVNDPELEENFLNCRNDVNWTSLHALSMQRGLSTEQCKERESMMFSLLKKGADANAKDYLLQTPLFSAATNGISSLLLIYGADVNIQNIDGMTILHQICTYYESFGSFKDVPLLLAHGANINLEDKQGRTCMMAIASGNNDERSIKKCIVPLMKHLKKLQSMGLDISSKNKIAYAELLKICGESYNESVFGNECEKELESMKKKHIDPYTSVYAIMFKSANEMTVYCENDVLQDIITHKSRDYPIYNSIMNFQVMKGKVRKPLMQDSQKSLIFLFRRTLPQVCLEMILHHLSDNELRSIIKSVRK